MSAGSLEKSGPARRVLALVLPELLCELAEERFLFGGLRGNAKKVKPLGVVLVSGAQPKQRGATKPNSGSARETEVEQKQIDATAKLSAVNESARRYGVREGQSIAEACALVSSLVVREISEAEVRETLGRI
ncbi:MAG TPA: hypothetical protein VHV51_03410, partial [Polyangiaceae bacterium]|nr:hypothetical protein [Polyangiaceae bacterium]